MNKIVLVSGKKRVGKDTFATHFIDNNYHRIAFADQLKKDYESFMINIMKADANLIDCHGIKKESGTGIIKADGKEMTNREGMQWYGQMIKDSFGTFYWVDYVCTYIKNVGGNFIITDVRFPFEIERTVYNLKTAYDIIKVRIKRNTGLIDTHISETAFDNVPENEFDYIIDNNSSLKNFHHKSQSIMNEIVRKIN